MGWLVCVCVMVVVRGCVGWRWEVGGQDAGRGIGMVGAGGLAVDVWRRGGKVGCGWVEVCARGG